MAVAGAEAMSAAAVAVAAAAMSAAAVAVVAAAVGAAGGGRRSDIRLKDDIVPLVQLNNGLELYRFRYKGSDRTALCRCHGAGGAADRTQAPSRMITTDICGSTMIGSG